jgi:RNA polymerase sigma-70 factor (ECF subfamily)
MNRDESNARDRLDQMISREPRRLPTRIGRLIRDDFAAEDLAQESLVRALRNLETVRGTDEALLCKWLDRIARNVAFNYARDEGRRPASVSIDAQDDLPGSLPSPEPDPGTAAIMAEDQQTLLEVMHALPAEFRIVFILRDVEGLSTLDTAATLRISDGLVKWRLHHARKLLRQKLAEPTPEPVCTATVAIPRDLDQTDAWRA